jgi:DNA-binding NarL/FixJ family response regulator
LLHAFADLMPDSTSSPQTSLPIRVLAADSTRMNSQLLADSLARDERFRVIEVEPTAEAILAAAQAEQPDVLLLSEGLEEKPGRGFEIARELRTSHPQVRVIMLLDTSSRNSVLEAFRAGARGVFCRTESLKALAKCISCAHAGQVWANSRELGYLLDAVSENLPARLSNENDSGMANLSKREREVVRCVVDGMSNREIAQSLKLTEHTVKNYMFRIFDKLGVSSRVEVVLYAFSSGQGISSEPKSDSTASRRQRGSGKPEDEKLRRAATAGDFQNHC